MKTYRAVIVPKPDAPNDEYTSALLRMELTFTIGAKAPIIDPQIIIQRNLADLHITNFMRVESLEEVKNGS
jgi:hypothetical protein